MNVPRDLPPFPAISVEPPKVLLRAEKYAKTNKFVKRMRERWERGFVLDSKELDRLKRLGIAGELNDEK